LGTSLKAMQAGKRAAQRQRQPRRRHCASMLLHHTKLAAARPHWLEESSHLGASLKAMQEG